MVNDLYSNSDLYAEQGNARYYRLVVFRSYPTKQVAIRMVGHREKTARKHDVLGRSTTPSQQKPTSRCSRTRCQTQPKAAQARQNQPKPAAASRSKPQQAPQHTKTGQSGPQTGQKQTKNKPKQAKTSHGKPKRAKASQDKPMQAKGSQKLIGHMV